MGEEEQVDRWRNINSSLPGNKSVGERNVYKLGLIVDHTGSFFIILSRVMIHANTKQLQNTNKEQKRIRIKPENNFNLLKTWLIVKGGSENEKWKAIIFASFEISSLTILK